MDTRGSFCPTGEPTRTDLLSSISLPIHIQSEIWGKPIALLVTFFRAGFLLGLFLDPEDGGDMFLRNVD
jgi:hypothetical protein